MATAQAPSFEGAGFKFTQGDAEWHRLRELFKTDLYWAASVVLNLGEQVPMREHAHRALCRIIEGRTGHPVIDDAHVLKLELPRDWGKTSVLTRAHTIQLIASNPNISILIYNEVELTAQAFLGTIKWHFEQNELFRALFPEVIPPDFNATVWSASRMVVPRSTGRSEPTVFTGGVGGTKTGMHPDVIIVDDMISREAMENARAGSWQIMHQTNRWINQLPALISKQYTRWRIYFMGTRWWTGDSYEHVDIAFGYGEQPRTFNLRIPLEGAAQVLPVTRVGDLVVFRRAAIEHGRSAFPEKWSLEDLAKLRLRDEALFACNYMNQPSDERTSTFKESWLAYYDWINDKQLSYVSGDGKRHVVTLDALDVQLFVDPGGFAKRSAEDRARPAVVVVGDDLKGKWLLLDVYNEHDTYVACIERIIAWCTQYNPRKVVIENAGQQIVFINEVRRAIREKGLAIAVDEVRPKGAHKEVRILGLEPYFQRGQILIGKGPAFHSFREQYTQFPRTARVDVLDVLAYVPQFVRRTASGVGAARSNEQRRSEELAKYRMRRGIA